MCKKYIGFGKCSKSYMYILFAFVLKILDDNFFSFISISPQNEINLFHISSVLSKHMIVQNFYKYLSFIIGGILFRFLLNYKTKNRADNINLSNNKNIERFSEPLKLIHYKNDIIQFPIT